MATYYVDGAVGSDSNAGTSAGAGNAWLTIGHAAGAVANGDLCYIKASATYSISSAITLGSGAGSVTSTSSTRLIGYTSSPGDNGRATVQASAGSINMFKMTGNGWSVENLVVDGNSQSGVIGINSSGLGIQAVNCLVKNCPGGGFQSDTYPFCISACEVTACGFAGIYVGSGNAFVDSCYVHDNVAYGILAGVGCSIISCVIANNTGATGDGIQIDSFGSTVRNCSIYGSGRDGIRQVSQWASNQIFGNVIVGNGGYGINATAMTPGVTDLHENYNAFYNNTSGARNILLAGPNDVTLSGDPFTNAAGGDFTLNNTAGAGASCRGANFPGLLP